MKIRKSINKAMYFMKARNRLVFRCRKERVNWKNGEDGENLFLKALAKLQILVNIGKLFMVQQNGSWSIC